MIKYQVRTTQQYGGMWTWELWDERGEIKHDSDVTAYAFEPDAIRAAKVAARNRAYSGKVHIHTIEVER